MRVLNTVLIAVAVSVAGVLAALYVMPHFAKIRAKHALRRLCAGSSTLVLTYDDGPSRGLTAEVLDLLGQHGRRATFFAVGARATEHVEVLDRVAREGHEIGSHSHDHHHPWLAGPVTALRDALKGLRSLERWVSDEGLFRPPHGKIDMLTWTAIRCRGARLAWWTVDSGDTWGELPQLQQIIDQVAVGNGGIVLMHDSDRDDHHRAYVIELTTKLLELADKRNLDVIPLGALLSRASTH